MELKVLTLNCGAIKEGKNYGRSGFVSGLNDFLIDTLRGKRYDFMLLQEFHTNISALLDSGQSGYKLLRMFDDEGKVQSELAILYRENFTLRENKFHSFSRFKKWNLKWPGIFGILVGKFQTPEGDILVGSLHLNTLTHVIARKRESQFIKQFLLGFNTEKMPVIFGGDFNTGLPGEKPLHNSIYAPEFINATLHSGPTVDSGYVEPIILVNKIAVFLARMGIHIRMKVDHIYMDVKTQKESLLTCKVLDNRVSDHSPMEVVFTDKK